MGTLTLITLWTGCAIPVFALQQEPDPDAEPKVSQTMTVVYQPEDFHDRSQSAVPVLVYQKEFFQRFEPLSVGDILKRIPGISGSADAGEFDLPQMRGIGPKYTQILINGERVPGAANDRTLERLRGLKPVRVVGAAYEAQRVPAVPRESTDQRLDVMLTEAGLVEFGRKSA